MAQNSDLIVCQVCGENYLKTKEHLQNDSLLRCECLRCGRYIIDDIFESIQIPWAEVRHLVSAWVRRENRVAREPFIGEGMTQGEMKSPSYWVNKFKHLGFPENLPDKLNALLIALTESVNGNYQERISIKPNLIADVAAKNIEEINGLSHLLLELGYLGEVDNAWGARTISAKGWLRVEELQKTAANSNFAFVAMWFHQTTTKYRESVIAAVDYCGYKAIILDQEEYNGFIMEQVVSQIRSARFVIADFTCRPESVENGKVSAGVRGGVYWEAGMAYGLNKPVIHTCEDNEEAKSRRHFDIDQYNTIFWKPNDLNTNIHDLSGKIDNPTFAEKLANRILWVVGKGSYTKQ